MRGNCGCMKIISDAETTNGSLTKPTKTVMFVFFHLDCGPNNNNKTSPDLHEPIRTRLPADNLATAG